MSKYETLMEMKRELKSMKKRIEALEKAEPTAENLEIVNAIRDRAMSLKTGIRHYAHQYGMIA